MKTLISETSPKKAFKMFKETFDKNHLVKALDDAFIHYTNMASSLRTNNTNYIAAEANKIETPNFLDILAVCHLFNNQATLYGMVADFKSDLDTVGLKIKQAKHQRDVMGDIFYNDLHKLYTEKIQHYQNQYNSLRQNIYTVEGMINLINVLKK